MAIRHNVLLLDAGDQDIRYAERIARDLGHLVFLHPSPVGAGRALVSCQADVVVLLWDFPAQQEGKLASLLRSWERFRALKKVVVLVRAGNDRLAAVLKQHRNAAVVRVDALDTELPRLLGQPSREFESVRSLRPEGSHFVKRLRDRLQEASRSWEGVAQGTQSPRDMEFPLASVQGQAQMLTLSKLAQLLGEVLEVTRACERQGRPSPEQYQAVAAALRFAIQVTAAPPYDADLDVSTMVRRLRRAPAPT